MSIKTDIIIGGRGSGKSARLVMRSAMSGTYILTTSDVRAQHLLDLAKEMGVTIPNPVTVRDWVKGDKFVESSIQRDGLYIDDLDDVVESLFWPIPIKVVTITEHNGQMLWTKKNPYLEEKSNDS